MNSNTLWWKGPVWLLALAFAVPAVVVDAQTKFGRRPSAGRAQPRNPMEQFSGQVANDMRQAIEDAARQNPAFQKAELEGTEQVQPLDFSALAERLPDMIGNLERVRVQGENVNAIGVVMAQVSANYANRDRSEQLKVSIYDIGGGLPGIDPEDIEEVKTVSINRETEDGYDRTVEIEGFKALQRLHRPTQTGEISVIAGDRVGVRVQGQGVPMSTIEAGIKALRLAELAKIGS